MEQGEKVIETPPPPRNEPPRAEMTPAEKKCFVNDGLKYKMIVTVFFGNNEIAGNVTSEDLESGKIEISKFGGTMNGDKLAIQFEGTPPVIGSASEWTDKPWNLNQVGERETLHIVIKAKKYNTNQWKETEYLFDSAGCK